MKITHGLVQSCYESRSFQFSIKIRWNRRDVTTTKINKLMFNVRVINWKLRWFLNTQIGCANGWTSLSYETVCECIQQCGIYSNSIKLKEICNDKSIVCFTPIHRKFIHKFWLVVYRFFLRFNENSVCNENIFDAFSFNKLFSVKVYFILICSFIWFWCFDVALDHIKGSTLFNILNSLVCWHFDATKYSKLTTKMKTIWKLRIY